MLPFSKDKDPEIRGDLQPRLRALPMPSIGGRNPVLAVPFPWFRCDLGVPRRRGVSVEITTSTSISDNSIGISLSNWDAATCYKMVDEGIVGIILQIARPLPLHSLDQVI